MPEKNGESTQGSDTEYGGSSRSVSKIKDVMVGEYEKERKRDSWRVTTGKKESERKAQRAEKSTPKSTKKRKKERKKK